MSFSNWTQTVPELLYPLVLIMRLFLQIPVFYKLLFAQPACSGILLQAVDGIRSLFCLMFQTKDLVLQLISLCLFQFLQGLYNAPSCRM